MSEVDAAVAALQAGRPIVLPFDTVYGLVAVAEHERNVRTMYTLKGRVPTQPSALVAATVEQLLGAVPELRDTDAVRALLPGPFTVILRNPARRFPWLTGESPDTIGVRVPQLPRETSAVVRRAGVVVATSANEPGGPDPATLEEVPVRIRAGAGVAIDGGRVPGTSSTVVDLTADEPKILREGAVPVSEVLARLAGARG